MHLQNILPRVGAMFVLGAGFLFAAPAEKTSADKSPSTKPADAVVKIRNEKVVVIEATLAPGETWTWPRDSVAVVVYFDDGLLQTTLRNGNGRDFKARRGTADSFPGIVELKNRGSSPLHLVQIEYQGEGGKDYLGRTGLAPDYKVLFENPQGRVYEIKIPAGTQEPLHTHRDRVVVGLSGAELEHILPDGRREKSSLKTGEIAWRAAATHIGHNIGRTDLWAIAIEPK